MDHGPTNASGGRPWVAGVFGVLVALGLGAAAVTGSPAPAVAQSDDMAEAKKHFLEGKKLYDAKKFDEAADHFVKAYELSDRGELLYNIGQAYRKAGDLRKAEEYLQKYLNKNPNPENEDAVVNQVIEIQQKLAARMATVEVETKTEGRKVFVDDEEEPRCETPCSVSIDPGRYEFRIVGDGMQTWTKTLSLERAETQQLSATLEPERVTGQLQLQTDGTGGTVRIPNVGEKSLPLSTPLELEVGEHELTVLGASGGEWTGSVDIKEGETTRLMIPLGSSAGVSWKRSVGIGLGSASVALLTGGILIGQRAKTTHSLLRTQQQRSGRVDPELLAEGRREQTTANVLIGLGTTTLLTGAGLYTWDLLSQ